MPARRIDEPFVNSRAPGGATERPMSLEERLALLPWAPVELDGAVGDGVTDDTAALQRAAARGLPILLQPGRTYRVDGEVRLAPGAHLHGLADGAVITGAGSVRAHDGGDPAPVTGGGGEPGTSIIPKLAVPTHADLPNPAVDGIGSRRLVEADETRDGKGHTYESDGAQWQHAGPAGGGDGVDGTSIVPKPAVPTHGDLPDPAADGLGSRRLVEADETRDGKGHTYESDGAQWQHAGPAGGGDGVDGASIIPKSSVPTHADLPDPAADGLGSRRLVEADETRDGKGHTYESDGAQWQYAGAAAAAPGGATVIDWSLGAPAAGVSELAGSGTPAGVDVAYDAFAPGHMTTRFANFDDQPSTTPLTADGVAIEAGSLGGLTSVRHRHTEGFRGANLVDPSTSPALTAGTTLWMRFPRIRRHGTGGDGEIRVHLVLQDGAGTSRGTLDIDLTDGTVAATTWAAGAAPDVGAYVTAPTGPTDPPTAGAVETIPLGGDEYELRIPYPIIANAAGGWVAYVATDVADPTWQGDGSDLFVEFVPPEIIVDSPDAIWPAGGVGGWQVADPAVGGHVAAAPLIVAATSVKPPGATVGVLEIVADNASGAGHLVARLDVTAAGEPRLWLTEDDGATARTMTLAPEWWATDAATEVALGLVPRGAGGLVEAVIYLDRAAMTGLPVVGGLVAVDGYSVRLPGATAALDATELPGAIESLVRSTIVAAELDAITAPITGINYVVLGAAP